jgi:hypothetical protein
MTAYSARWSADAAAERSGFIRALIILVLIITAAPAGAFVLHTPRNAPWRAEEDVARAPRWDGAGGAMIDTGRRGLGGGLEYAIDDSVCAELRFVDAAPCSAVKAAIAEAFSRWAHGPLSFTDVTGKIAPERQGATPGWIGAGAEIDIFAEGAATFPAFRQTQITALTAFYFDRLRRPILTSGAVGAASEGVIMAADIRIFTERCYTLSAASWRPGCAHFPSVMLHEIGHALFIDHPDERPERNLDTDDDPTNAMTLDCSAPRLGLKASPRIMPEAVSISMVRGAGIWARGLTADDRAARDALYGKCSAFGSSETVVAGAPRRWGAMAMAGDGAVISISGAASESEARAQVAEACARSGRSCPAPRTFSGCHALAVSDDGHVGEGSARDLAASRTRALAACAAAGGKCRVKEAFCTA